MQPKKKSQLNIKKKKNTSRTFAVISEEVNKVALVSLDALITFDSKKYVLHPYDKRLQYTWGWYSGSQIIPRIKHSGQKLIRQISFLFVGCSKALNFSFHHKTFILKKVPSRVAHTDLLHGLFYHLQQMNFASSFLHWGCHCLGC